MMTRARPTPASPRVLGTNCEQTYDRYLRVGEEVTVTTRLESVVGPKQTGVGEGYFVTTAQHLAGRRRARSRRCCSGCSSSSRQCGRAARVEPVA